MSLSASTSTCRSPKTARKLPTNTRIVATLPTIEYALRRHAKVILASHLGRPKGKPNPKYSLRPVVDRLRELIDKDVCPSENVGFSPDCVGEVASEMAHKLESGQVLLLENLRYHAEEEANDPAFSKALASLAEIYVNDAFGSAHRAHASTEGITHFADPPYAGLLMEKEITYLGKTLEAPEHFCRYHRRLQNLRPKSTSSRTCSTRWIPSSSSAAWPTPSIALQGRRHRPDPRRRGQD